MASHHSDDEENEVSNSKINDIPSYDELTKYFSWITRGMFESFVNYGVLKLPQSYYFYETTHWFLNYGSLKSSQFYYFFETTHLFVNCGSLKSP